MASDYKEGYLYLIFHRKKGIFSFYILQVEDEYLIGVELGGIYDSAEGKEPFYIYLDDIRASHEQTALGRRQSFLERCKWDHRSTT